MVHREFFLQIELVPSYSPLAPVRCSRHYGRDCMRSPGHEIGRVTPQEIFGTTFDAMVYRRYHDAAYTMPVTDPLVAADVNEPPWDRRVPGSVLFADVGDTLAVHVRNADMNNCHSLHMHGLAMGSTPTARGHSAFRPRTAPAVTTYIPAAAGPTGSG